MDFRKWLYMLIVNPISYIGLGLAHRLKLRELHDEQARIKALKKKNKDRFIECPVCGKEMKGAKDEKSGSDEEVIFTCQNPGCGFVRDIRKERITPKSINQFYGENQRKTLKVYEFSGTVYKSLPGKLPNNNTCKAVFVIDRPQLARNCPYCGEKLVSVEGLDRQIAAVEKENKPEKVEELKQQREKLAKEIEGLVKNKRIIPTRILPFVIPKQHVIPAFQKYVDSLGWFAPKNVKEIAKPEVITGIYIPHFYIEKGFIRSTWLAGADGELNRTRKSDKKGDAKEDKKPDNNFYALLQTGYLEGDYTFNTQASSGINAELLGKIREINPKELVPFDPGYFEGWAFELYQSDVSKSFGRWQKKLNETMTKEANKRVYGNLRKFIKDDGKEGKDIKVHTEVTKQTVEQVFIPVWVSFFSHDDRFLFWRKKKSYQFLINGFNGQVQGPRIISTRKLAIFYAVMTVVISFLVWGIHRYWHNGIGV
ncbi:MAG: hypothetical protein AAGA10_07700 [Bacteroidota bacterium]